MNLEKLIKPQELGFKSRLNTYKLDATPVLGKLTWIYVTNIGRFTIEARVKQNDQYIGTITANAYRKGQANCGYPCDINNPIEIEIFDKDENEILETIIVI
jgi:hypothetical protein